MQWKTRHQKVKHKAYLDKVTATYERAQSEQKSVKYKILPAKFPMEMIFGVMKIPTDASGTERGF